MMMMTMVNRERRICFRSSYLVLVRIEATVHGAHLITEGAQIDSLDTAMMDVT